MAEVSPNSAPASGAIDFTRAAALVRRRILIFLAIALAVATVTTVIASRATPRFEATARLAIDPRQRDLTGSDTYGGGLIDNTSMDTEVQILGSRAIAVAVVEHEGLAKDPEFVGSGKKRGFLASIFKPKPEPVAKSNLENELNALDTAADALMRAIAVKRAGSTYIINVSATSTDPEKAARLANAYVAAYVGNQVKIRNSQVSASSGVLTDRASQLRSEAEAAGTALQEYKIRNNLISAQGSTSAEQEVSVLNQQIATAQADLSEKQARFAAARAQIRRGGGGADIGAALSSETIRQLRAQEALAITNVAQLTQRYGERMQLVTDARSQLEAIERQIQSEISRILSNLESEVQVSQQRLESLRSSLNQSRRSLVSNNSAMAGLAQLQSRADIARATYEAFQSRADQASAQEGSALANVKIVSPAKVPRDPSSPNIQLAASLGLVGGMVVASVVVAILELMVHGIQTGNDVERKFGVPYAGGVPLFKSSVEGGGGRNPPEEYLVNKPFSAFAESMRSLWTFMLRPGKDAKTPKVVAIVSALPGEGKSLTAFCLTRTMAMNGSKVVLVDCDIRRRGASSLAPKAEYGLLEVLSGEATLEQALVKDDLTDAWFLRTNSAPETAHGHFTGARVDALIKDLSARFEFVLLDTAPVLAVAETRELAAKADAVLFLGRWSRTPAKAMELALDLVLQSGANLVGVALTQIDLRKQSKYGYGDQYSYFDEYKKYYTS